MLASTVNSFHTHTIVDIVAAAAGVIAIHNNN